MTFRESPLVQVGIVAALPGELKPLVRGWQRSAEGVFSGRIKSSLGEVQCFAVAAGMGAFAATRGLERVLAAAGSLDAILSLGWAGSLADDVHAPQAFTIGEVVESRTGERYRLDTPGPTLVTAPHVVPRAEKRALAARYGASLVDMEAATLARLARARGIPFLCVKAVSDGVDEDLPDFNRFTANGKLRMSAFLAHVILRPRYWRPLKLLGINSKRAAEELAKQVPGCLGGVSLIS